MKAVRARWGAMVAVALLLALAAPAFAHAATFTNEYPFGAVNAPPQILGVTAFSSVAFDTRSAKMTLDGATVKAYLRAGSASGYWSATEVYNPVTMKWTIKWTWVPVGADPTKATVYAYPVYSTPLADGTHTVTATIKDVSGATSADSWTFSYLTPPTIGAPTPTDGSTVATTTPTISAPVSDNDPRPMSVSATVNGSPSAATIVGGVAYITSPVLANDATATVAMTLSDAAGSTTSRTWSFFVQIHPEMTSTLGFCSDCHPDAAADPDMTDNCSLCHAGQLDYPHQGDPADLHARADVSDCNGCHMSDITVEHARRTDDADVPLTCASCHNSTDPDVAAAIASHQTACASCHDDLSHGTLHDTTVSASCAGSSCHSGANLVPIHASDCDGCHVSTAPAVVAAIAGHDKACTSCHNEANPHPDNAANHLAAPPAETITISSVSFGSHACSECHAPTNLLDVHDDACASCHPEPKDSVAGTWALGCTQGDCHTGGSAAPMHNSIDASHTYPAGRSDCLASGCHDASGTKVFAGKSLALIHSDASTTTPDGTRTSCQICHAASVTPAADCATAGCHPDRLLTHGYDPAKHTADSSCVLECHVPLQGELELKPVHDAVTTPVLCTGCHATKVAEIAPWDKTCTACHAISELHTTADHVGTDVAYQDASFLGNGCSTVSGHTEMLACHDLDNIAVVHSRMTNNGCEVCHGDGKTPAQECLDCHSPGYATDYTRAGTPSANIVETGYPSSDVFMTPGWTYTTTPVGQAPWQVVNTPYPPANTTRYVTITTNAAGGMLFGFNRPPTVPDNAKIVNVLIYAKAKATTASPARKMQGWYRIGGQDFLSSNQSANLSAVWTGGAGTLFGTSPIRYDYTREPLYGEQIRQNPKTMQDWTPAEINGTDPDSSLDAFGINLTGSATANNISFAQIYLKVTYYTVGASQTFPTVGTHTYHGQNVKYLHDPSDAPVGQRFAASAPHGWYWALYYQDCYDFCHRGNAGAPTFSANQGKWMWYSVGGDPTDSAVANRTLTLKPIAIPAGSTALTFNTNYRLYDTVRGGSDFGYVEASTDGTNWTPLSGSIGGTPMSSITGNAAGWIPANYDLSAYAGQSVRLRFRYQNDVVSPVSGAEGWAFDSLQIVNGAEVLYSDDAETLKPDWTNSFWTRSMGAFPFI